MVMDQDLFRGKVGTDVKVPESTKLLDMQLLGLHLLFAMLGLQDTHIHPLPPLAGTGICALALNMTLGSCQLLFMPKSLLICRKVEIHDVSSNNTVVQNQYH